MEPITGAVAGLAVGTAAGWIARGLFGGDTKRAIEDAKERLSEAVKVEVAGALRGSSNVLVGMARHCDFVEQPTDGRCRDGPTWW